MLNAFLCLQLSIDLRCSGSYSRKEQRALAVQNALQTQFTTSSLPAAAAGSTEAFAGASPAGLRGSRLSGLRVRVDSDCLADGDRERRSNRERRDSGSVWSKRERLTRRSSSAMVIGVCEVGGREVEESRVDWKKGQDERREGEVSRRRRERSQGAAQGLEPALRSNRFTAYTGDAFIVRNRESL